MLICLDFNTYTEPERLLRQKGGNMKEILVKESNRERIESAIKDAQGKATARTIDFDDILKDIKEIEYTLGIAKKYMLGIKADIDHNAQDFPKAYKYTPESTHYMLVRKTSGWAITGICRRRTRGSKHTYNLELTEDAKREIINSMQDF